MRIMITLELLCLALWSQAQVLTVQDLVPMVGDTFYVHGVSNDENLDPGPMGNDVIWDFSGLLVNTTSYTRFVAIEPATAPDIAIWPTSDLVLRRSLSFEPTVYTHKYYDRQELGLYELGEVGPVFVFDQGEPDLAQVIPCFFGEELTTPFCYLSTALDVVVSTCGELTQVMDGTGTLILPTGTYENVMRTMHYRYNITNASTEDSSYSVIHRWWDAGRRWPLLELNSFTGTNDVVLRSATVLDVGSTTQVQDEPGTVLKVMPNPFHSHLTISLDRIPDEEAELTIWTTDGRAVGRRSWPPGSNTMVLHEPGLPAGPLICEMTTANEHWRIRVVHIP